MHYQKEHTEIVLDASKIMILMLKKKNILPHGKGLSTKNWRCYFMTMSGELAKSLGVDHTIVSKCSKALGMIQKQGLRVLYKLKPRDVERRLVTCEQLLQRQKRKSFWHRIMTGEESGYTMITLSNKLGYASTSSAKLNIYGSKLLLCI